MVNGKSTDNMKKRKW